MTITLTREQERAIQQAIESGLIRSVGEFIESAVEALPRHKSRFDKDKACAAVARIRELRKGVRLELNGISIREFAHIGHRN
jgi:Arc/MetJ-type ribon-helix-helix transcriptional regulator